MEPIVYLIKSIESDRINDIKVIAHQLKELWSVKRNCSLIWSGLIDKSAKLIMTGNEARAYEWMDCFICKAQLPLFVSGEEAPIFKAFEREPRLAYWLLSQPMQDWNCINKRGETVFDLLINGMKKINVNSCALEVLINYLKSPRWDPNVNDQGVQMLFNLLPYISLINKHGAIKDIDKELFWRTQWLDALIDKGVDINAPRAMETLRDKVKINTPLSFLLKRLVQWDKETAGLSRSNIDFLLKWIDVLLSRGADPSLQLEPGARLHLMSVVEKNSNLVGVAQKLELKVIENGIKGLEKEDVKSSSSKRL